MQGKGDKDFKTTSAQRRRSRKKKVAIKMRRRANNHGPFTEAQMAEVPSDEAKSSAECSICMEPYDPNVPAQIPKLLICAHTFCVTCLDGLFMKNLIVCPICRAETVVKDGVNKLHKNFALIEVLSQEFVPPQTETSVCSNCKKNPVSMYCPQCDGEMCEECVKSIHQIVFFASHEPAEGKKPSAKQCSDQQKGFELFCEEDERNARNWTEREVVSWICSKVPAFLRYQNKFMEYGVNGESLLEDYTSADDFQEIIEFKPHASRLWREVVNLKRERYPQYFNVGDNYT